MIRDDDGVENQMTDPQAAHTQPRAPTHDQCQSVTQKGLLDRERGVGVHVCGNVGMNVTTDSFF